MSAAMFNPLMYANKLKQAGFTEQQAEIQATALTELIDEKLVTKEDFHALEKATKRDLQELANNTKRDLQELANNTKHDIEKLATSTKRDMENLATSTKRDIYELEERMTYKLTLRFGSMLVAGITLLATLIKLH